MRCRVWNDNPDTDWKETFKGDVLVIPKGKYIEMEFHDAHEFKGQYSPIRLRSDDTQDPASFKRIRVEKIIDDMEDGEIEVQTVFPCNMCKKAFDSDEKLVAHSEKMHADKVIVDQEAERAAPKKGRPKVEVRA